MLQIKNTIIMKTNILKTSALIVLAISIASFTSTIEKKVKVIESDITWKAYKVTGSHEGTLKLSDGTLIFEDDQLTGGNFVIDMTTINVTDLEAGSGKEKLEGHLNSDEFFGTSAHKTATFNITDVEGNDGKYQVTGDFTIKGKTESNTFEMIVDDNSASANLKIDRTKFDIKYGSSSFFDDLKDKAISDEFDLNVNLKF